MARKQWSRSISVAGKLEDVLFEFGCIWCLDLLVYYDANLFFSFCVFICLFLNRYDISICFCGNYNSLPTENKKIIKRVARVFRCFAPLCGTLQRFVL